MKLKALLLATALALASAPAIAADPNGGLAVTTGSGTTLCAFTGTGSFTQVYTCTIPVYQNGSGVGVPVSTSNPMPVTDSAVNTTLGTPMQNSGGSVTANAGTNLNTSLLATDAHLTALGTSALVTDSHFTTALGTGSLFSTMAAGSTPTNGIGVLGKYLSGGETLTNTQTSAFMLDANGYMEVNVKALIGEVGIDQTTPGSTNGTSPVAAAVGGATPASILSANSTNATNVKASAGTLYHISLQNNSTTALAYAIFFNTSSTPTCTSSPYYGPVLIPYVGSTGNNGSGVIEDIAVGLNFSTGLSYCLTTAPGGTGSVAANQVTGGLGYK